jgi:SAM-dependent methyltransferase
MFSGSHFLCASDSTCIKSSEEAFTQIYDNGVWGYNEDGTPSSGWGSFYENTRPYFNFLLDFMNTHQPTNVLDIGCGDWAFSRYIDWKNMNYTGIDVVKSVVELDQQRFGAHNITFIHGDFLTMELPEADLLICKDVLLHLTNADISIFLEKIKDKYRYCLITNDIIKGGETVISTNRDLSNRGENRPLDLNKPPFNVDGVPLFTYAIGDCVKQTLLITRD